MRGQILLTALARATADSSDTSSFRTAAISSRRRRTARTSSTMASGVLRTLARQWARLAETGELGDVASEAERDRPVDDDPDLATRGGQRVEVVRPGDEPAEKAAQEPNDPGLRAAAERALDAAVEAVRDAAHFQASSLAALFAASDGSIPFLIPTIGLSGLRAAA